MKRVRLKQKDLHNIVKKVMNESESRDTFEFKYEYSRNLMAIEREFLSDDDKLQDIIDVYQSHIKQLKSIIHQRSESKKSVNEDFDLDPTYRLGDDDESRFETISITPMRVSIEIKDNETDEHHDVVVENTVWGWLEIIDIYPSIDDEDVEFKISDFIGEKSDDIFREL